jgi:hypothetical protein
MQIKTSKKFIRILKIGWQLTKPEQLSHVKWIELRSSLKGMDLQKHFPVE